MSDTFVVMSFGTELFGVFHVSDVKSPSILFILGIYVRFQKLTQAGLPPLQEYEVACGFSHATTLWIE